MRAAIFQGPKDITVGERPDPVIQEPTDAIVRVALARRAIKSLINVGSGTP